MNVKGVDGNEVGYGNWVVKEGGGGDDGICDSISIGSISEDSTNSVCSSSSSEMAEDASSSTTYLSTSSSSSLSNGPLYELAELMTHLPMKRGLSMFYQGKAQSFTSLDRVQSLEDLPKKGKPGSYRKKIKSCKSYGGGLDSHKISHTPKATISKKASRSSVSLLNKRGNFLGMFRPSIAAQELLKSKPTS